MAHLQFPSFSCSPTDKIQNKKCWMRLKTARRTRQQAQPSIATAQTPISWARIAVQQWKTLSAAILFTLLFTLFPIKCFEESNAVQRCLMPLLIISFLCRSVFFLVSLRLQSAPKRNGNCRGPRSTGCQSQRRPMLACWVCWIWVWILSCIWYCIWWEKSCLGQSSQNT